MFYMVHTTKTYFNKLPIFEHSQISNQSAGFWLLLKSQNSYLFIYLFTFKSEYLITLYLHFPRQPLVEID